MLRTRNKYCSNCLATQRFLDLGTTLVCERCNKRLEVAAPAAPAADGAAEPRRAAPVCAAHGADEPRREAPVCAAHGADEPRREAPVFAWPARVDVRREAC